MKINTDTVGEKCHPGVKKRGVGGVKGTRTEKVGELRREKTSGEKMHAPDCPNQPKHRGEPRKKRRSREKKKLTELTP